MKALPLILLLMLPGIARAQENHERHHPNYQGWVNQNGSGCCNNQDCGELKAVDERESATGIEVRIEGQWCPVQAQHYLKKGNAPNWLTSHVCVTKSYEGVPEPPCARLLCYQPRPKV